MADALEPWHAVEPRDLAASILAASILAVTIVFTVLCLVVVGLRVWIRINTHCFGREDWLMCVGTVINMVHNGIVIWGTFTGIGTADSRLNTAIMIEGAKVGLSYSKGFHRLANYLSIQVIVFWQIFYVSGSVFIKASICAQLMRIATKRRFVIFLWILIALSVIITFIAILAVLIRCKPVAASWNPALGTCIDQNIIIVLTYVVSGMNIATDWSVSIIPIFILWNIQMRKTLKMMVALVMGVGVLSENVLYGVGQIILWTVVECGLGIIAGSMPMLRKLFRSLEKDESSYPGDSNGVDLVTIGRIRGKHHQIYDTEVRATVVAGDDRDSARDDEGTKQMIKVTRRVDQMSPLPKAQPSGN
ncbi:integral membrane PTH11 [Fusarium albosuccineum]|uniref:Integral membrane PTH11 n=1 Tax=Fusarium albosuccineum TaxID=1237068 RepID=A0A8H4LPS5_9HYPO|nr:integral membrane PTH11 [Fusarium albosuccineum]